MIAILKTNEKNEKNEKCETCQANIVAKEQSLVALYKVGNDVVHEIHFCKACVCDLKGLKKICKRLVIPEMRLSQILTKFCPDENCR